MKASESGDKHKGLSGNPSGAKPGKEVSMANQLTAAQRRAIIKHCLPGMTELLREMHRELVVETNFDTGDLRQDAYASVDDETGRGELGYDETGREKPHGYYYTFGTSNFEGDPALMRVAFRRRRPRRGDGR